MLRTGTNNLSKKEKHLQSFVGLAAKIKKNISKHDFGIGEKVKLVGLSMFEGFLVAKNNKGIRYHVTLKEISI